MNRRYGAFFIFLIFSTALGAIAQPTLPDIAGIGGEGSVILSWNCQYDKVKAITVMRSRDSLSDFEVIGYVKKREKGIQKYVDNNPPIGKNYYKLAIIFSSGLTWRSNYTVVNVTGTSAEKPKQPAVEKTGDVVHNPKPIPSQLESSFVDSVKAKKQPDTCKTTKPGIVMAFTSNTATSAKPVLPKPKVKISFDDLNDNTPIFIRSRYIYVDSATGHVNMFLTEDVSMHNYSVKFYDKDKHLVTEIPKINSPQIIIDKRNFQRKGVYKFTLRKDYTELESGYLIINPNQ